MQLEGYVTAKRRLRLWILLEAKVTRVGSHSASVLLHNHRRRDVVCKRKSAVCFWTANGVGTPDWHRDGLWFLASSPDLNLPRGAWFRDVGYG